MTRLTLTSVKNTAVTYSFRATSGFGWALCTVNDGTGELLITSDWGDWSHRWDPRPECLGHPTLTAFLGERGDVDYIARKLQREGRAGRRWSARETVRELRQLVWKRRRDDGREQFGRRLTPEEAAHPISFLAPRGHVGRYSQDGLPIYSCRMPSEHRAGRPWDASGKPYDSLPYLTRDAARRLWKGIGDVADECGGNGDLFYVRVQSIDGFHDYVTTEPWQYGQTEQTPEDRALRDIVLPALISACRDATPPARAA
jgi:hypothetical protein